DLRRRRRCQFDEAVQADSLPGNATVIDQAHAILDAGPAIGNLAEVVAAEFLLLLEAERTVVGRNDLKIVSAKALPELLLIGLIAQWRSHDIFRAFKPILFVIAMIEEEILGTCFGESRQTEIPGSLHLFERIVATEVHDVYRRVRHLGNRNGTM